MTKAVWLALGVGAIGFVIVGVLTMNPPMFLLPIPLLLIAKWLAD